MAFLYIGTCQARSESAHPNDAQLKLLSWVSPTPDQSFMTRSVADDELPAQLSFAVEGNVATLSLCMTPDKQQAIQDNFGMAPQDFWEMVLQEGIVTIDWYVNGQQKTLTKTVENECVVSEFTDEPGEYQIYALVGEEGDYIASNTITVTLTEPVNGGVSQIDYCAGSDILSDELVNGVITRVPGDDNPISVTLNIDERVSLAGDIQWSFTKTDQYLTIPYNVYPSNNGFSADVDVPEDMGDYDLTATFKIAEYQTGESAWEVFAPPYVSCPKTITVRVEEPSVDPCEAAYIVSDGNPVDEIELHQGEDIVVPLSISDNAAVGNVVWETTYPNGINVSGVDVDVLIFGPSATTAPGEYTVTATINELRGISIGDQWIDFSSQPISCPAKQVVIKVLGNDEPTPEPTPVPTEEGLVVLHIEGNTTVCPDDEVTLVAVPEVYGNTTIKNCIWLYDAQFVHQGSVYTFVPSELFGDSEDKTVTAEVAYGDCVNPATETAEIEYLPEAPEIHITLAPTEVCVGGQITATIQNVEDLNNPIYNWYVNGVELPGEHMGEITLNMPMEGEFVFAATLATPVCGVSVQSDDHRS